MLGLFASHGISFGHNYLGHGMYRLADVRVLISKLYGRMVVLYLPILLGASLMMGLKSPAIGLALLVVLKIIVDLRAHLRERAKFAAAQSFSA